MVEANNVVKEAGIQMGELIVPNVIRVHADNTKEAVDNTGSVLMNILAHIIIQAEITCLINNHFKSYSEPKQGEKS